MNAFQVLRTMADMHLTSREVSALESPSSSSLPGPSFWALSLSASFPNLWDLRGVVRAVLGVQPLSNKSLQPFLVWVRAGWGRHSPWPLICLPTITQNSSLFSSALWRCLRVNAISPPKTALLSPGFENHTRVKTVLRVTLVASEYFHFLTWNHLWVIRNLP